MEHTIQNQMFSYLFTSLKRHFQKGKEPRRGYRWITVDNWGKTLADVLDFSLLFALPCMKIEEKLLTLYITIDSLKHLYSHYTVRRYPKPSKTYCTSLTFVHRGLRRTSSVARKKRNMASHKTQKALKSVQNFLSSTSALGNFSEPRWCAGLTWRSRTSLSLEPFCSVNNGDVPLPKVTTIRPYASSSRHKEHLYLSERSVAISFEERTRTW